MARGWESKSVESQREDAVSRKDSVVYAKRPSKVADTCWSDSMKLGQCTSVRDK